MFKHEWFVRNNASKQTEHFLGVSGNMDEIYFWQSKETMKTVFEMF